MLKAFKALSRKIYHCTWLAFIASCDARIPHPWVYPVSRILVFLQQGVGKHLALSTVKDHISALAVFFQCSLASHSLVWACVQGVVRIAHQSDHRCCLGT